MQTQTHQIDWTDQILGLQLMGKKFGFLTASLNFRLGFRDLLSRGILFLNNWKLGHDYWLWSNTYQLSVLFLKSSFFVFAYFLFFLDRDTKTPYCGILRSFVSLKHSIRNFGAFNLGWFLGGRIVHWLIRNSNQSVAQHSNHYYSVHSSLFS